MLLVRKKKTVENTTAFEISDFADSAAILFMFLIEKKVFISGYKDNITKAL